MSVVSKDPTDTRTRRHVFIFHRKPHNSVETRGEDFANGNFVGVGPRTEKVVCLV